ncbi:hypothetical protein YC2023_103840 [Brassica napus]
MTNKKTSILCCYLVFSSLRETSLGAVSGRPSRIYTTEYKPLRAYLQDAICRGLSYGSISGIRLIMVCVKVVKGENKGPKRGILVEQRGHGATNKDDYTDQARWSSPSIQDFGNLSKRCRREGGRFILPYAFDNVKDRKGYDTYKKEGSSQSRG